MRRTLLVGAGLAVLTVLGGASWVRVGGAGAWSGGRYLDPGLRLRPPFAAVRLYPAGEQRLACEHSLGTLDGGREIVTVTLAFTWDPRRLAQDPLPPDGLPNRLRELFHTLDGRYAAGEVGREVERELPTLLRRLPITATAMDVGYRNAALESLVAAARPTGRRTVLVGLDGFDWVLLDRLIAAGRCPTFARMKREGAWADLVSHQPVLSPLIWTSIASGRRPEDHGVLDFVVSDPVTGKDVPVTTQARRVHAFWNILSSIGRRVHVVNWWATYPAEKVNGILVSERVFYQLFGIRPTLTDPGNVYPSTQLSSVLQRLTAVDDVTFEEVRRFADVSRDELEQAVAAAARAENPYDDRLNHLRQILAVTRSVFAISRWLLQEDPPDLLALYVEGTDTIGHRFAHFLPPRLDWVAEDDYRRYHDTMVHYYELCDAELATLMRHAAADTTWIVAADHGFHTGPARPRVAPDDFTVGAAQWHRLTGVLLALGPDVKAGKLATADIYDLCRTLLWLHGAPASRALEGRELVEMVEPTWVAAHPPRAVGSYDDLPKPWREAPAPASRAPNIDQERLKELEALGYVSAGGGSAASAPPPAPAPTPQGKATERYNLAKIAQQRGDLAAAERLYLEALAGEPRFAVAMMNLAVVYRTRGQHAEALRWFTRALETGDRLLPGELLVDFVREAHAAGRLDGALAALDTVRARWQGSSSWDAAHGVALALQGHTAEAAEAYSRAHAKDPADAVATEELLRLAKQGARVDVQGMLERHRMAVGGDLARLNNLAVICLRNGRPEWAERVLADVLASDPANAGVLSNLAVALQMQGKLQEAAAILARAVAARPADANLRFNYGAVLAALELPDEALTQLAEARRLGPFTPRLAVATAKVLVRLGRESEARALLAEGAGRHPEDAEIRELLAILQRGG